MLEMTHAEIEAIAEEAAEKAVRKLLLTMGVDLSNPLETQKDMAYLRTWRTGTQRLGWKTVATILTVAVGGTCTAIWLGLKSLLHAS
jgi:hypothetical protein